MRSAACVWAAAALVASALGGRALAKAPKPDEMPTVEEIHQQAKQALEKGSGARPSDPVQDTIDAYKDKAKTPLSAFEPLTNIINNVKESQPHRANAAEAIHQRFLGEEHASPEVRALRRAVANAILELLKVDEKRDPTGLEVADYLLNKWYRPQLQQLKYVKSSPQAKRRKVYDDMKKFLKGEN